MSLIKSISGIRGTIGGKPGKNLTPLDAVKFATAYGTWLKEKLPNKRLKVVIGRDARLSGEMIQQLVMQTLVGLGIDVWDIALSTTPTVSMTITKNNADGGIILTASHNPKQWNALKLFDNQGEFLNAKEGQRILELSKTEAHFYAEIDELGRVIKKDKCIDAHIKSIIDLPLVREDDIRAQKFKVVVDGVCSTGGISVPPLLKELGVEVVALYCDPTGLFPHNPEPLAPHLIDLSKRVVETKADFGIAVDPDVDRLALIDERGQMFGEEYTLVACADYVLSKHKGSTVSNLSSSRALQDLTVQYGADYQVSAVGEVNVVEIMKKNKAVIGGEGNGGVIYPELHYGRDALVGIALILSLVAERKIKLSDLKKSYPNYYMSKKKVSLTERLDVDGILKQVYESYHKYKPNTIDGVKIDFEEAWVHLRKSNTEPIIRVYTEAKTQEEADQLAVRFIGEIETLALE